MDKVDCNKLNDELKKQSLKKFIFTSSIYKHNMYDIELDHDMKYTNLHDIHLGTSPIIDQQIKIEKDIKNTTTTKPPNNLKWRDTLYKKLKINTENEKRDENIKKYKPNDNLINIDGIVSKDIFQPKKEFPEILDIMKRHKSTNAYNVREERYVIYRNYLLNKVSEWYHDWMNNNDDIEKNDIDYLIWIDLDLKGFDISSIAHEFSVGWKLGYDVLCTNGIKYTGWYYDSYATVFHDGEWSHGIDRWRISNKIRDYRFYDMRSCFGGFTAYNFKLLLNSGCKYQHFGSAYSQITEFQQFSDAYMLHKVCEHLPLNFCLRENGAQIGVATRAHSFYGTYDLHG